RSRACGGADAEASDPQAPPQDPPVPVHVAAVLARRDARNRARLESSGRRGTLMHRAVARVIVVGLLLGGAARADSGWREIGGPHVVLRTDLGSGAAREAALAVERFRAQIIAAGWPRATLPAG